MLSTLLNLASLLVSVLIPTITTYKALESNSSESQKPLIIYWLILAGLTTIEFNFYFILKYVPLYQFIRLYISLWLVAPQTKGYEYIYCNAVQPFLEAHLRTFENLIKELNFTKVLNFLLEAFKTSRSHAPPETPNNDQRTISKSWTESLFVSESTQSDVDVSLWKSLANVWPGVDVFFASKQIDIKDSGRSGSTIVDADFNSSNGFDVVDKADLYSQADEDKSGTVILEEENGWFSNWWGSKESTKEKAD